MPKGVLWFIFNLRIKKRDSHLQVQLHLLYYKLSLHWSVTKDLYILEQISCHWHTSEWVHPGFCPKADWFTFASTTWLTMLLRTSRAGSLAWLSSAWLAQILLYFQSSKAQALINHTDTHHKTTQLHGNYIQRYILSFSPHFHRQVEEGLLDQKNSVGHS
jgi:hypothetical protein